jgi:hypothetical protein
MTVKRAVGAVLSRGASWIQGRDGGGEVEIARLSSMKSRSFLQSGKLRQLGLVLRIRDVYPGPRIRIFSLPDSGSEFFPIRIRIKEFRYFIPKKLFLSSRKYDSGCSSRIRILLFTHPGSRGQKGTGSRGQKGTGSQIRNTDRGMRILVNLPESGLHVTYFQLMDPDSNCEVFCFTFLITDS